MEERILARADFVKFKFLIAFLWTLSPICLLGFIIWSIDSGVVEIMLAGIIISIIIACFTLLLSYILKKRELVVTNKRVVAKGAFGFRKDIPIEKVTSFSTFIFMGIGCSSPSAKIRFNYCKNKLEVFDAIVLEATKRNNRY